MRLPSKDLNDLCNLIHSNQWSVNLRPLFWIFFIKPLTNSPAAYIFRPWSAPEGRNCSFFRGNSQIVYWNIVKLEAWPIIALKAALITRNLEIARNATVARNKKVDKKLPSNLWQALRKFHTNSYNSMPYCVVCVVHKESLGDLCIYTRKLSGSWWNTKRRLQFRRNSNLQFCFTFRSR